ncbi:hypothetical protein MKZ38_006880 [Zalerion maritima]|uniref:Uncharacterized protein n=1 Tax=Zalerion maritima TaxID=339359 RepID=A0AAD5RIJ2_9PEZI|nr:hypothetical protein MKZ38_006880 [Zalerion maritima]
MLTSRKEARAGVSWKRVGSSRPAYILGFETGILRVTCWFAFCGKAPALSDISGRPDSICPVIQLRQHPGFGGVLEEDVESIRYWLRQYKEEHSDCPECTLSSQNPPRQDLPPMLLEIRRSKTGPDKFEGRLVKAPYADNLSPRYIYFCVGFSSTLFGETGYPLQLEGWRPVRQRYALDIFHLALELGIQYLVFPSLLRYIGEQRKFSCRYLLQATEQKMVSAHEIGEHADWVAPPPDVKYGDAINYVNRAKRSDNAFLSTFSALEARLLSRRVVVFSHQGLVFKCPKGRRSNFYLEYN